MADLLASPGCSFDPGVGQTQLWAQQILETQVAQVVYPVEVPLRAASPVEVVPVLLVFSEETSTQAGQLTRVEQEKITERLVQFHKI